MNMVDILLQHITTRQLSAALVTRAAAVIDFVVHSLVGMIAFINENRRAFVSYACSAAELSHCFNRGVGLQ